MGDELVDNAAGGLARRTLVKGAAVGGAVAWVAPAILSGAAASAGSQPPGPPPCDTLPVTNAGWHYILAPDGGADAAAFWNPAYVEPGYWQTGTGPWGDGANCCAGGPWTANIFWNGNASPTPGTPAGPGHTSLLVRRNVFLASPGTITVNFNVADDAQIWIDGVVVWSFLFAINQGLCPHGSTGGCAGPYPVDHVTSGTLQPGCHLIAATARDEGTACYFTIAAQSP